MKFLPGWLLFFFLLPGVSMAAAPAWQIVPGESSISFTATENGGPVNGKFKTFSGDINFAPDQLGSSSVNLMIDVASISDAYNQLAETLKAADWFNTKVFPQAIFKSSEFVKTGNNTYQVKGKLTIRDKTRPIVLQVTQVELTPTKARMTGTTTINRSDFGVGQGQWSKAESVKNEVNVTFTITATHS
jgi:polyisoprenoid-binding protein YceI